jgi:plastocyanin
MRNLARRIAVGVVPVIGAVILVADSTPTIKIRDDCQPATFNLPAPDGAGPGTCATNFSGNTSFAKFIDELMKHQDAPEWRFDPQTRSVEAGTRLSLDNYGGETHTFTEVAKFGGGFVAPLNALSGNPVAAPECLMQSVGSTFVPPGAEDQPGPTVQGEKGKVVKYQCCIHPWMRTEIMIH